MKVTLQLGLPADQREQAARLYWQAFGGKLGRVMGPEEKALRLLDLVIREDHAIVALDEAGQVLGLVGFKTPDGGFANGGLPEMRQVYGWTGTLWRAALLWALEREVDNERFLLDGICVASSARGQGIGAALMGAICEEGRARGYGALRLDVIDTNWRAKALYERLGFVVEKTDDIGLLRYVFGFSRAITMVKPL